MNAVFAGSGDDALGFALAGVEVVACPDPAHAESTLAQLGLRGDIGVVLLAPQLAAAAPRALAALERRKAPVLLVGGGPP